MNDSLLNATSKSLVYVNALATKIVVGIIIFLVGLIIARIVSKLSEKVLRNFAVDTTMKKKTGVKTSFEKFISSSIFLIIMLVFLVIALNYIGVTNLLINILSIAIIVVVTVSLLLSVRDSVPNIIAYRSIRSKDSIKEGDHIQTESAKGIVEEISLFQIKIIDRDEVLYIPNSLFIKQKWKRKKRK